MGRVEKDWKVMKSFLRERHADFISEREGIASEITAELQLSPCA